MAKTLTTRIVFAGVDSVSKVLGGIQRRVANASRTMSITGRGLRQSGIAAGTTLAAPLAAIGKDASDTFMGFDSAIRKVQAVRQVSEDQMKSLEKQAFSLAETTPFTPTELMLANEQLAMMGMNLESIQAAMPEFVNFAIIGDLEVEKAADRMTNIIQSLHGKLEGSELQSAIKKLNDQVSLLFTSVNLSPDEATQGLERLAPTAKALGIGQEDAMGMLGALALSGFKGKQAANALRTVLLRLNAPTKEALKGMQELVGSIDQFRTASKRALTDSDISQSLIAGGMNDAAELAPELNPILSDDSLDIFDRIAKAIDLIEQKFGDMDAAAEEVLGDSLANAIQRASGELDEVKLLEALEKASGGVISGKLGNDIFGKQRFAQGSALVANLEDYRELTERLKTASQGYAKAVLNTLGKRYLQQVNQMVSRVEAAKIRVFKVMRSDVEALLEKIGQLAIKTAEWAEANPELARLAARIAAITIAITPLLIYIGLAAQGLSALAAAAAFALSPLAKLAAGIAGLAFVSTRKGKGLGTLIAGLSRMGIVGGIAAGGIYLAYKSMDKLKHTFGPRFNVIMSQSKQALEDFMNGDNIAAAEHMRIAFDQLKYTAINVADAFGKTLAEQIANLRKEFSAFDAFASQFNMDAISAKFDNLLGKFPALIESLGTLKQGLTDLLSINVGGDSDVLDRIGQGLGWLTDSSITTALDLVSGSLETLTGLMDHFGEMASDLSSGDLGGMLGNWGENATGIFENLANTVGNVIENLTGLQMPEIDISSWFNGLGEIIGKFETLTALIEKIISVRDNLRDWVRGQFSDKQIGENTPDELTKLKEKYNLIDKKPAQLEKADQTLLDAANKLKKVTKPHPVTGDYTPRVFSPELEQKINDVLTKGVPKNVNPMDARTQAGGQEQETIGLIRQQTAAQDRATEAASQAKASTDAVLAATQEGNSWLSQIAAAIGGLSLGGSSAPAAPAQPPVPLSGNGFSGVQ